MPLDQVPQAERDLLDLASDAGQLALTLEWAGKGLGNAYDAQHDDQLRALRVWRGTVAKARAGLDALISEALIYEGRVALTHAIQAERRGFVRDLHLERARTALSDAGRGDLAEIIDDHQGRVGGDNSALQDVLDEIGG